MIRPRTARMDRALNEWGQAWASYYAEAFPDHPASTPAEYRIIRALQVANLSPAFDRRPAERIRQRFAATGHTQP